MDSHPAKATAIRTEALATSPPAALDSTDPNDPTAPTAPFPIPASQRPKLGGWQFYHRVLNSAQLVVAPMVDQSELAWRLLSRRHGAQLCYSPMFHANIFTQDSRYRAAALQSCPDDRPLIIQFCGNDPQTLLAAGLLAQDHCDAVDINLGCPQAIAKRGNYGCYLQDEWPLLQSIVSLLHTQLAVPVTCKIRVFECLQRTIEYARMLEAAGCQLLTVHGRTRDQKGALTGVADWSFIRAVREALAIPVFANGNIQCMADVRRCLRETGAQAVMTAEGNLHNPALFDERLAAAGEVAVSWRLAEEYLQLVHEYPCPIAYVRGHLFKMFHHLLGLPEAQAERERIAVGQTVAEFGDVVRVLREKFEAAHEGRDASWMRTAATASANLSLPPWVLQPYVRAAPAEHLRVLAEKEQLALRPERERPEYRDGDGNVISHKQAKKLRRVERRPNYAGGVRAAEARRLRAQNSRLCVGELRCLNPIGLRCQQAMCRRCCRLRCNGTANSGRCVGHGFGLGPRKAKTTEAAAAEVTAVGAMDEADGGEADGEQRY